MNDYAEPRRFPRSCERVAELETLALFVQFMSIIANDNPSQEAQQLYRRASLTLTSELAKFKLEIERGSYDSEPMHPACRTANALDGKPCATCVLRTSKARAHIIRARFGETAKRLIHDYCIAMRPK